MSSFPRLLRICEALKRKLSVIRTIVPEEVVFTVVGTVELLKRHTANENTLAYMAREVATWQAKQSWLKCLTIRLR